MKAHVLPLILAFFLFCLGAAAQDPLREGFSDPPRDARPRVWWHWMNGNISKDGIRKDLEWMDRAGIVGFHNFDAGLDVPQVVDRRLAYMTPEWKDAFRYMLDLADSLGMEVSLPSSPGWSCTGGPWVRKEDAMKKLVWRTMEIDGGCKVECALPEPYETCGFYQDIPQYPSDPHRYDYYRDVAVIAVRMGDADRSMQELGVTASASDGSDVLTLFDGSLAEACTVSPGPDGIAWVMYSFPEKITARSFFTCVSGRERNHFKRALECSDDGISWRTLLPELPMTNTPVKTFDIDASARFFRLRSTASGQDLDFTEFIVSPVVKVSMEAEKSGFYASAVIGNGWITPATGDAVREEDVIDISPCCTGGMLQWDAPEGRWRIFRFGWNLTGKRNGPASPEATGLEVDKFDADAVARYYSDYLALYDDASGGRVGSVIKYIMLDSYEAKCQTWTATMPEEFLARRGYSLLPWLPAVAGTVIGSSERTERFLCDWRQTLGELLAEKHYDSIDSLLAARGLGRHTESQGYKRTFVSNGMDLKRHADIPMSEFWVRSDFHSSDYISEADIRESSSVCHLYGQRVCAAESFTADGPKIYSPAKRAWSHHPGSLKPVADAAMASGVTRFIIHTSVHQPVDSLRPGLGLGKYGQWFTRQETWAEEAKVWTDYLARSTWMLGLGKYVADIAYYFGETTNVTGRFMDSRPEVPLGYSYDFVNRTALFEALRPGNGVLTTDTGMSYRVLVIDREAVYISTDVLRRIREFADAGVLVAGNEPLGWCDLLGTLEEFEGLVRDIWYSGRDNVVPLDSLVPAMLSRGIVPDVQIRLDRDADIRFVHRTLGPGDGFGPGEIYWVTNLEPEYVNFEATFRTCGYKPQIWHPDTGKIGDISYCRTADGRMKLELDMVPDDAFFIIFRGDDPSPAGTPVKAAPEEYSVRRLLSSPWTVRFQEGRGAPAEARLGSLSPLSESEDPGIRYFSGTATYTLVFRFGGKLKDGMVLDLGRVGNMARVVLNGIDLGLAWKEPYRLDVGNALRRGRNVLEIKVTNTWVNRTIGDVQPGVVKRVTYVPYEEYDAGDPLLPSGLMGPVRILAPLD